MILVVTLGILISLGATLVLLACVMSNAAIRDEEDRQREIPISNEVKPDDERGPSKRTGT